MIEILFAKVLVVHIIAVMVAVGTVTVTDYLHILGLRSPKVERRTLFIFPHLSRLILISLIIIYVTGSIMVLTKPEILTSGLFWTKIVLVLIVTVNGFVLHHLIFPKIEKEIKTKSYSLRLIKQAAFGGSLSVVSWYGIVVLSITKELGYSPLQFILFYVAALIIAYFVVIRMETKNRKDIK